jgi:hypothetical protein
MPRLLAALFGFTALAVCIIYGIEPWTSIVRGFVAFAMGHVAGAIWESLFGAPGAKEVNASDLVDHAEPGRSEPADENVA